MAGDSTAPKFSILVPTHDRDDVIIYAIRSALYQTDSSFEILVVCDGCTEETKEVVRSVDDERIRLFDLPKAPGHGWANRNVALRQARGDLIAFLGDDDLWLPDHLERFRRLFTDERVEWAYSRPLWVADDGVAVPLAVDLRRPTELDAFLNVANSIPAPCVVHRRSALDRYGYWPDDLWNGERYSAIDWELWRRMIRPSGGANVGYVPIPTCVHFRARWRPEEKWLIGRLRPWMDDARGGWWPTELRFDDPSAATPQQAVWEKLTRDAAGWTDRIRSATTIVIDGFASAAVAERQRSAEQSERVRVLEASLAEQSERVRVLEASLTEQTERVRVLEASLAEQTSLSSSILASRSWRATAPARQAARLLRKLTRH